MPGQDRTPVRASDRVAVLGVLAGLTALSWAYLLYLEWGMRHMDLGASMLIMPAMTGWGFADLCLVSLMWAIMMMAMMLRRPARWHSRILTFDALAARAHHR